MQEIIINLAERVMGKRYGKYRGSVADNNDPQNQGRLKVQVPSVLGDQKTNWALPCIPFGGMTDQKLSLPEVGSPIWIEFEEGDISRPIWTGTLWPQSENIPEEITEEHSTEQLHKTIKQILQRKDEDNNQA